MMSMLHSENSNCACTACSSTADIGIDISAGDRFLIPYGASADGMTGTASNGKTYWTADEIAAYLNRSGANWIGLGFNPGIQQDDNLEEITFGFFTDQQSLEDNGYVGESILGDRRELDEYSNFAPFTEDQMAAARQAIQLWDDLIAVSFRETSVNDADINYGNLADAPDEQAYARLPQGFSLETMFYGTGTDSSGDVWVSRSQASNFELAPGGYGLNTLVHETGHALGLSHPGNYNFAPGFDRTYENGAEYYQDSRMYSIMSYWQGELTGASLVDWSLMKYSYNSTPMVHDILAIQQIYGADITTRTGDTIYGFNSNADRDVYDFTANLNPNIAIWDAGGNDTLDVSGFDTASVIDLNPGAYSSAGGFFSDEIPTLEEVNARRAEAGLPARTQTDYDLYVSRYGEGYIDGLMRDNIGIAYGTSIENAVGGGGNDLLIANSAANRLDGGAGIDTASYRGAQTGVTIDAGAMRGTDGDAAGDRYIDIENFEGGKFADRLLGGNRDDTLSGLAGDDILSSGNGDDRLDGGDGGDLLDAGNGNDALSGGDGNDRLDGGNGDDMLDGGAGDDRLTSGNGSDRLTDGAGDDVLEGGKGADTFVFTDLGGTDRIADFRSGQDRIDLSAIDAITGGEHDSFQWIGGGAFSGAAGELRGFSQGGTFVLAGDVDGDRVADFIIQATQTIQQSDIVFA